jgi:signal peptidase II
MSERPMQLPRRRFVAPLARFGLGVAAVTCLADQAIKLWLLGGFDLAAKGVVAVAPMVDLVLTRNTGISYGLFQYDSRAAAWLLIGITLVAVVLLCLWLVRAQTRITALALGLILGGAVGNGIDRLAYGWVVDFVLLYLTTAQGRWNWYVFNLADAAIVAGVIGLLYDSLIRDRAAKAP